MQLNTMGESVTEMGGGNFSGSRIIVVVNSQGASGEGKNAVPNWGIFRKNRDSLSPISAEICSPNA